MQIRKIMLKRGSFWLNSGVLLIFFGMINCKKNCDSSFLYQREFSSYLEATFGINRSKSAEALYFVLPLHSCEYCLEKSYEVLSGIKTKKHFFIVLVGDLQNYHLKSKINFLQLPYVKLHDVNQEAYRFGFGLAKPMLISIKSNGCVFGQELSDELLEELPKMIE